MYTFTLNFVYINFREFCQIKIRKQDQIEMDNYMFPNNFSNFQPIS